MTTQQSDRMKTRAMSLAPNGGKAKEDYIIKGDNLIDERESIRDTIKEMYDEQESITIPKLEKAYENRKVTREEYADEMRTMNKTIKDLVKRMHDIDAVIKDQNNKIENIAMETKIQNLQNEEKFEKIEEDSKVSTKETLNARRTANDNQFEIRNLKRTVENHALKLNATSTMKAGAWALHSDEDAYPILKNEKFNHWSKYNDNVKNIVLEGDNLMDLQKFWNTMDTAFTSTVNANKGLGEYETLTETYSAVKILVPPPGHTQRNQGLEAYKNFTRVLRDHLLKKNTINKDVCPKAYKCLTKNQLQKDGFDILTRIMVTGSPQLGGIERDLTKYVEELVIKEGEELIEFYHRTKEMEYEINLQKDQTGQSQRLTRRFLQQLQKISEYKKELGIISKGIKRFFQDPAWIHNSIPHTIDDILDELEDADVSTSITLENLEVPTVNAGRIGREDIVKQGTKRIFLPKEEYLKQQRERREKGIERHNFRKDCTCQACGYTTRELHKLLNNMHTGDPKNCLLRGPKYINDKETRERVNQYNLKHKDDKRVEVSEERLDRPPQHPTLPKTNHLNGIMKEDIDYDEEAYVEEEYYSEVEDEIENDIYNTEETLPTPTVSSLSSKYVESPKNNQLKFVTEPTPMEDMRKVSSFRVKQE